MALSIGGTGMSLPSFNNVRVMRALEATRCASSSVSAQTAKQATINRGSASVPNISSQLGKSLALTSAHGQGIVLWWRFAFPVLSENLTRGPFHAAFRNTTKSVLVTAIR